MSEWISVKDRLPDDSEECTYCKYNQGQGYCIIGGCEVAILTKDTEKFYEEAMKSSGSWNEPPKENER